MKQSMVDGQGNVREGVKKWIHTRRERGEVISKGNVRERKVKGGRREDHTAGELKKEEGDAPCVIHFIATGGAKRRRDEHMMDGG